MRTGARARRRAVGPVLTAVAMVAMAGCAGETAPEEPAAEAAASYDCMGTPVPIEAITDPRPATELDADGRAALEGLEVPPIDPAAWIIASATAQEVVLLRELDRPDDHGAGDVRTHERLVIAVVDAPNIENSPAWVLTALGTCALAVDVPGAGTASVTLDPDHLPEPASTQVHLLVTEKSCNSGQDAAGRVDVASLRETDTVIEMVLVIQPREGMQTCPSNPPTPYVLTLTEPVGDRTLYDASTVPPRPVAAPD